MSEQSWKRVYVENDAPVARCLISNMAVAMLNGQDEIVFDAYPEEFAGEKTVRFYVNFEAEQVMITLHDPDRVSSSAAVAA